LSAGRMVRFTLSFRVFSAALSVFLKLCLGREEFFIILTVSCLTSSAISTDRDSTAFSTPARMSSMGVERGVTAKLRSFCSNDYTASSSF
jgi:hypothetical protein